MAGVLKVAINAYHSVLAGFGNLQGGDTNFSQVLTLGHIQAFSM